MRHLFHSVIQNPPFWAKLNTPQRYIVSRHLSAMSETTSTLIAPLTLAAHYFMCTISLYVTRPPNPTVKLLLIFKIH